jgi:outer membrane immunogenic protein
MFVNRAKLAMLAGTSLCLSAGISHAAPVDPWVGWYAGGNIGYSWGRTDTATTVGGLTGVDSFGSFTFPGGDNSTRSDVNGVIGGVQAGYVGRIAPHWLGGIEADIQWSGQKGSARSLFSGNTTQCTTGDCSFSSLHDVTTRLNWFGTFRGRAGFESNGVWLYGTAGLAFGDVSVSGNTTVTLLDNTGAPDVVGIFSRPFSYSQLKGGWAGGVGAEGLIGDGRWRWKVEYLHIDLGTINGGLFGSAPFVQVNTTRFTDEIVRVGFNYRFDNGSTNNAMNAFAADMPVKAMKAPPPAYLGWTGWYVGVNAGYIDSVGKTNTDATIVTAGTAANALDIATTATNQFNNGPDGFLGGVQAGYNYQFSPSFVAGVEADIQGTTLRRDFSSTVAAGQPFFPTWVTTTSVSNRLDYLGTVRARVGVTPTQNLLIYSTGGLAYGGVRSSTQIAFNNTGFGAPPGASSGSFSDTRFGWTAGGGFEWMFSPNWTAKLEYLYYDLGSASYATGGYAVDVGPTNFPGFGIESIATRTTTRFEGSIVRVGLNYKFGGGPLVAKY